jgi:hypothetical protein
LKIRTMLVICLFFGFLVTGCGAGAPFNTPTPAHTPTPPNTTSVDLTNISLKSEDLPEGFHLFTKDEIKLMGNMDLTSIVQAFGGGANLVKSNVYGKNPTTIEFLIEVYFYPLSSDIISQIDNGFLNPDLITKSVEGSQVISDLSGIGNGSMGLTTIVQEINMNLLMIRRNNTLIVLLEVYQSETSNFDLKAIGPKADQAVLAEYK